MAVETLRPDGTVAVTGWEANPHLKLINDAATAAPALEASTDPLSAGGEYVGTTVNADEFTISLGGFTLGTDVVSSARVLVRWRGTCTVELRDSANVLASNTVASGGTVTTTTATYDGTLTQQQITDLRVRVVSTITQSPQARVGWVFVEVTHDPAEGEGTEDTFVRVAGEWVASDRVARVIGAWV
jgi:hypothetical protein